MKKLYRSKKDRVVAGVLGGLGEYTSIDPTILRLGYVLLAFVTHLVPALIVYILAIIIIPTEPSHEHKTDHHKDEKVKEAEYTEEKK